MYIHLCCFHCIYFLQPIIQKSFTYEYTTFTYDISRCTSFTPLILEL